MLWVKAFHILFVVSWFAGLFYLPRIFVNLAMVPADSTAERERLLLMAGKLFRFMTPLGVLAIALGLWLWFGYGFTGGWLHAKTALVIGLAAYHAWCGMLLAEFRTGSSITFDRFTPHAPLSLLVMLRPAMNMFSTLTE